jgi:hypothetical protein
VASWVQYSLIIQVIEVVLNVTLNSIYEPYKVLMHDIHTRVVVKHLTSLMRSGQSVSFVAVARLVVGCLLLILKTTFLFINILRFLKSI